MIVVVALVAAVVVFVAGYLLGLRARQLDASSYWQGFADGELHQRLEDRTPSVN